MIGILLLLGLGLGLSALLLGDDEDGSGGGGGGGGGEAAGPATEYTDEDDTIISEDYRVDTIEYFADLVGEGEVTQDEADAFLDGTDFPVGALNVSTGAGEDAVVGSDLADRIETGTGDDVVMGGDGDDWVDLGEGSDAYGIDGRSIFLEDDIVGFPNDTPFIGTEASLEGGDDTIIAGPGNDAVADGYGNNLINGRQGDDFLIAVDQDGVSPDTVYAGYGNDVIVVDEGDTVVTSNGRDIVTVDLFDGISDDYQPVVIEDFDPAKDTLELEGSSGLLWTPEPTGPGDTPVNPISVADLEDGSGAAVSVDGVVVAIVKGAQGMSVSDVRISI